MNEIIAPYNSIYKNIEDANLGPKSKLHHCAIDQIAKCYSDPQGSKFSLVWNRIVTLFKHGTWANDDAIINYTRSLRIWTGSKVAEGVLKNSIDNKEKLNATLERVKGIYGSIDMPLIEPCVGGRLEEIAQTQTLINSSNLKDQLVKDVIEYRSFESSTDFKTVNIMKHISFSFGGDTIIKAEVPATKFIADEQNIQKMLTRVIDFKMLELDNTELIDWD